MKDEVALHVLDAKIASLSAYPCLRPTTAQKETLSHRHGHSKPLERTYSEPPQMRTPWQKLVCRCNQAVVQKAAPPHKEVAKELRRRIPQRNITDQPFTILSLATSPLFCLSNHAYPVLVRALSPAQSTAPKLYGRSLLAGRLGTSHLLLRRFVLDPAPFLPPVLVKRAEISKSFLLEQIFFYLHRQRTGATYFQITLEIWRLHLMCLLLKKNRLLFFSLGSAQFRFLLAVVFVTFLFQKSQSKNLQLPQLMINYAATPWASSGFACIQHIT